jgi:hypothetical protein
MSPAPDKFAVIKNAILNRRSIIATYKDLERHLCPHVLGRDKDGNFQGLFYQFGGASSSKPIEADGSQANWRCLALDKLSNVRESDGWHSAPNYSAQLQSCVKEVLFEVASVS